MTKTAGVIGLGLIGGSFARAAKAAGLRVVGADSCPQTRAAAKAAGAADVVSDNPADAAAADEIFIAVPVGQIGGIFAAIRDSVSESAVVFDGGSCKRQTVAAAAEYLGEKARRFVPSHPIAGAENSGFAASSAELFAGRRVILCPAAADQDAAAAADNAWRRAGANTVTMTAETHDEIFAAVSHLPHLLSFALVESIRERPDYEELLKFAAGGFRDFTRIAGSHPEMWRDICLQNGDMLLGEIARFRRQLDKMEEAVQNKDGAALFGQFSRARAMRRSWRETLEK